MRNALGVGLVAAVLALSACSGAATGSVAVDSESGTGSSVTAAPTEAPTANASVEQVANNTDPGAAMQKYIACLAKNGVKMSMPSGMPSGRPSGMPSGKPSGQPTARPTGAPPSGGMGGPGMQAPAGVSKTTWAKAQKACASLLPKMPSGGAPGKS